MKVLTIKEPFASLIKNGTKKIETRSWKTKYRGELYIHAGITKPPKQLEERKELMKLTQNLEYDFGYIICKCNLIDCVYMTKEYVEDMRQNNRIEYLCGEYKEGRYAWILDNIEIIGPIKAKGQLGIWNFY